MIAWDNLCKAKAHGGLGLHDPETLSRVSGAKIWWRWLANPNTPWASLWKTKYANNSPIEERIRMSEVSTGSVIWNSAIQHRDLIQQHSFWEIGAGNLARFWEDNWQQEPNMYKDELEALKNDTNNKSLFMVNDFWDQVRNNRKWRICKDLGHNEESPLKA